MIIVAVPEMFTQEMVVFPSGKLGTDKIFCCKCQDPFVFFVLLLGGLYPVLNFTSDKFFGINFWW